MHLPDADAAQAIATLSPQARILAERFWPGALTMVLPLREGAGIASLVTAGLDSIAVRVPAHPVARALLRIFGGPLAAPSANRSGRISPTSADHVLNPDGGLDGRIAAVLDAGPCPVGVESTIIGWQDSTPACCAPAASRPRISRRPCRAPLQPRITGPINPARPASFSAITPPGPACG